MWRHIASLWTFYYPSLILEIVLLHYFILNLITETYKDIDCAQIY